jgi:hypothetical protein
MTSMSETELQELEFTYAGKINRSSDDGTLSFNIGEQVDSNYKGWVYLWVKVDNTGCFDICYVGKAGFSFHERCRQHAGGFKGGSRKGLANATHIDTWLRDSSQRALHIYARKSPTKEILNEPAVDLPPENSTIWSWSSLVT